MISVTATTAEIDSEHRHLMELVLAGDEAAIVACFSHLIERTLTEALKAGLQSHVLSGTNRRIVPINATLQAIGEGMHGITALISTGEFVSTTETLTTPCLVREALEGDSTTIVRYANDLRRVRIQALQATSPAPAS